jgi:gliding motility-associated-like protein
MFTNFFPVKNFYSILFTFLLLMGAKSGFAQPPNDDPCNATLLTAANSCTYQTYTTAAATTTLGPPAPGCSNFAGGDVWFKLVVPCTGSVKIDCQTGVVTDGGMAIYSGTCNNLTLIECDDDDSPNGLMPMINRTGLTVGDTIFVRFWEYGNDNPGTFGICASIPPPPGPNSNCSSAQPFCTGTVYNFPNNTNVPSLGSGGIYGCLFSTPNPVFYYFQIQNPGPLDVLIVQTSNTGAQLDVDFACWGPFPDLASSCNGLAATNIVDCSYSTANTENCNIPNAQVGEYYVLLLTNFSNQPGNITFQQNGGVASTNCNVICNITAANTGPVCPGQTINLSSTLAGASYTWTGPDCFSSTLQNPTGITAPTQQGSYTYTVLATTPAGENCFATTTVVVGGLPNGTETHTNTTCPGLTDASITVTPSSPDTYIYTLNPGNIVQNNNPVFTNLGPGTYTATFTNPIGCSGSVTNITITDGSGVIATATPQNTSCPGVNDGTITVNPPATGAPFTYVLTPGNIIQNNNPVFTGLAPNFYNINISASNGCQGTVNNVIVLQGNPVIASATASPTSCSSVNDGAITVTPPANAGNIVYTLTPGNIIQNNNPVFTGLASGVYTINFTTQAGCGGIITPNPVVGLGAPLSSSTNLSNPPCANINDGQITIVPATPGVYTYTLNPGAPNEIIQNNPTFTGLAPGTYNYSFVSASGCIGTGSATLTTNTPLSTTVSMTMPLCNGGNDGTISLSASGGIAPYEYSIDGGANWQSGTSFNTVNAGPHTIRIRDNVGCIFDTTVIMSEPTLLQASAFSTPGTCNGTDGQIIVTGTDGTPGYTYSIDNGVNYQPAPNFTVSGGNYPDIKVKDANGCVAITSVQVALIDNMVITPVPDTTICVESSVVLIPNVSTEATIFSWSTIPDSSLINTLNNPNIKTPTATPTDTTVYVVQAIWGVCARIDTIQVNVLHKPIPYAGVDMTVCNYKRDTILVGSSSDTSGPVSYHWEPANTISNPDVNVTTATPDSTQTYTLTVTDDYGCNFSVTDNVIVFVQPPVPAFAGNDTIAVRGSAHQLMATGGGPSGQYEWSPSPPLNFSDTRLQNPTVTLNDDQLFIVVVTDGEGCLGTDSIFVRVYDGPTYFVPTSFTPNNDGLNDFFRAVPSGISRTEWFRVYNRYGQMVFNTNRWLQGWDGTFQGKPQPAGTYVWMVKGIDKDGNVVEQKGTVILIN